MYKDECIKELKDYIDITVNECCKKCEVCCESNNCVVTRMLNGFTNMFGIDFYKKRESDGVHD